VNLEKKDYRLAAIMYTDIVGFSGMMERDEAGTLRLLSLNKSLITASVATYHGTVIKTIADSFLIDFKNTVEALQCAIEIQEAIYAHNKQREGQPLLVRIGLHLGDIYFFENDALGEGINIASRLQSICRPGCICLSQDTYNQVLNKIDFRADSLGKVSLKNISKEIHAYEISSPNVAFDPDHDKTRSEPAPRVANTAERSYDPDAARAILGDIRRAILSDTKAMGRRLTIEEALDRYGEYGVEAKEVIADMSEKGLIQRQGRPEAQDSSQHKGAANASFNGSSDLARDIGRAVEGIARAIEQGVGEWQKSGSRGAHGQRDNRGNDDDIGRRAGRSAAHVADTIERDVENMDSREQKRAIKQEYKRHAKDVATGSWDSELWDSDHFKPGTEELETDFSRYRDKLQEKSRKASSGFLGNILSFLGVNALLWYINLNFAPGFFWAPIVSAGWGTGIVSGFFAMLRGKAKSAELEAMPELEPDALDIYKKINRVKDSMAMHVGSILSVPLLLFVINLQTSPGFLWAAIPSGIMAISFLSHLASYPGTRKSLEKKLLRLLGLDSWRDLMHMGSGRRITLASGPYASLYAEVASIRDDIVRDLKAGKGSTEFGMDMIPTLDSYVDQVRLLSQSVSEIDSLVSSIPLDSLQRDREALILKRQNVDNTSLKNEYSRSIQEIERQEKAFEELDKQRELLRLRLNSSANAIKQLKLDMARLKAMPEANEVQAMETIRRKAEELAGYMDDLKTGYEESISDPYAELERLNEEAEARARLEKKPKVDSE
jgi:class 3 adenylate cyclase